jgi:hypothetical protein
VYSLWLLVNEQHALQVADMIIISISAKSLVHDPVKSRENGKRRGLSIPLVFE